MSSIWDDLEKASVKGNRDRISYGKGALRLDHVSVKRSENPKEKGTMRMIVEGTIVEHDVDSVGDKKSFTLNMSSEFTQGECKALIATALGEPVESMTGPKMQKAVEGGTLIGKTVGLSRVLKTSKGGNEYAQSHFYPYVSAPAFTPPKGWFPHPDDPTKYYNAAGEIKTREQLSA